MKIAIIIAGLTAILCGCSTRSFVTPDGKVLFRSERLGTKEQVREIVYRTPDGAEFVMKGYSSDQVEALAAVTEAAVKAAISSMNPAAGLSTRTASAPAAAAIPPGYKLVPSNDPSRPQPEIVQGTDTP